MEEKGRGQTENGYKLTEKRHGNMNKIFMLKVDWFI